jgi:hypothetical protein
VAESTRHSELADLARESVGGLRQKGHPHLEGHPHLVSQAAHLGHLVADHLGLGDRSHVGHHQDQDAAPRHHPDRDQAHRRFPSVVGAVVPRSDRPSAHATLAIVFAFADRSGIALAP